eukprot:6214462-Pleurochrysis_carterae.AAC.4
MPCHASKSLRRDPRRASSRVVVPKWDNTRLQLWLMMCRVVSLLAQVIGPANDGRGNTALREEMHSPDPTAKVHQSDNKRYNSE